MKQFKSIKKVIILVLMFSIFYNSMSAMAITDTPNQTATDAESTAACSHMMTMTLISDIIDGPNASYCIRIIKISTTKCVTCGTIVSADIISTTTTYHNEVVDEIVDMGNNRIRVFWHCTKCGYSGSYITT